MTSFLKSAKSVYDVECDLAYIEITYERFRKGVGYATYTDYISAEPLANWVYLESSKQSIPYEKFLDTMVTKTLEVRQRMAELTFENLLSYEQCDRTWVRIMHAMKILDPTFQPPHVNMKSAWQMECAKTLCKEYIPLAIQDCINKSRLKYFFNVLRIIELE